jgi:hypothetical protein
VGFVVANEANRETLHEIFSVGPRHP